MTGFDRGMIVSKALFTAALVLACHAAHADAGAEFDTLLDDHWQWTLENNPVFASRLGDRRFNRAWPDASREAANERQAERRALLARVYALPKAELSDDDRLSLELLRRELQQDADAFRFDGHLMPFSHRGGVQNLDNVANFVPLETESDVEDWLARMEAVPQYIEQTVQTAEFGRQRELMPPAVLMQRIPDQVAAQLVENGTDSPFFKVFAALPASIDAARQDELRARAIDTIESKIVPAYRRLQQYFVETYLPAARQSIGLSSLENGADWYAHRARHFTTTQMTPDDIHRLGLDEVRRIRNEMQSIIDDLEFDGDFGAFLEFLRTDPQFYFDDPQDLLAAYRATSKRIDPELVRLFGKLPRMPYGVQPIPDAIAPDTTTAYYSAPASDGSRAGIYWVNLYRPDVRPKYEIEVLTVHEAMPGHHLQIALQQELDDMPAFRRYSGFTAFTEGWGLYSEALGYELGLYEDPYSRFGQLTYEMWRAVRLVVDTGIHYKGWTRQQAIDFFKDNAAKTELDIINEIDRYIGNPGQALAYKVGQLKLLALREDAENALGERFDIRAFHDAMLGGGALPLDLLEQRMNRWLEQQLRNAMPSG